jgi:hypothetical protein
MCTGFYYDRPNIFGDHVYHLLILSCYHKNNWTREVSMDNVDVAILTRLNDLADRHGLKPYDYIATLDNGQDMDGCGLRFTIPCETSAEQEGKARKMFMVLGVDESGVFKGGEKAVIDALDQALQLAPKVRPRP